MSNNATKPNPNSSSSALKNIDSNVGSNSKRRPHPKSTNGPPSIDVTGTAPPEENKVKTSKMASISSRKVDAEGKPETSSKKRHKKDFTPSSSVSSDDDSDKRSSSTSSSATAFITNPVSCTDSTDQAQSQEALSTERTAKYPPWVTVTADSVISNLKDKLTDITVTMNSFTKKKPMTKAIYDEMILKAGEQDTLLFEIIKKRKLVPDEHLGKYSRVLYPEYKEGHPLSLLCFSWATAGCCSIREAFVTKASRSACPLFTGFCIYVNFHPFSLDYDDGKSLGLDALTGNRRNTNIIIGLYHSMVIETLLPYVDVASTSSKTHDDEFGRLHAQALFDGKILPMGRMPHMELLYNAHLGHIHWNILKEIDISATEREILFMSISSIIQNPERHSSNFNEETALCYLKKIVEENPSCMRDPAYQTYVTKQGESYDEITRIRSAIGSKSGKISTSAAEKYKKGIPLLDNEKRKRDGVVKGGKSATLSKQSHFWSIKGENEDKVLTEASMGDVWKYVETKFKKCCGMRTLKRKLKMFVEENEAKKWTMIDFKKTKKCESLPFTVLYEKNPAYEGCLSANCV